MITIHPTTHDEVSTLIAIQKAAFFPIYERYHDAGNPYLRGEEDILKRLDHPYWRYFTICLDGEIVGGITYKLAGRTDFFDPIPEGMIYLGRLYIDPRHQCRGIGQTAIALAEREFPDAKMAAVDYPSELMKNRRCYEKAGYRDTGRRFDPEPGLTLVCMTKEM